MSLVLRWRVPEPRLSTRWLGPAGMAEAIEREPLYPVAAVVGPPGRGGDPVFPPLAVEADAATPVPAAGTGSGAWSTVLDEPVFWDGTGWRTLAHFVGSEPAPAFLIDYTAGTLDPAVTLARAAGPATWYDDTGLMRKTTSANVARFDHDPVTLAPRGLLVEPAATNLIRYSEQQSNPANWLSVGCTFTAGLAAAPDGTTSADLLTEDTDDRRHMVYQIAAVTNGARYTASIHIEPAGRNYAALECGSAGKRHGAVFDLTAKELSLTHDEGANTGATQSIVDCGDFCRVSSTVDQTDTTCYPAFGVSDGSPLRWVGAMPEHVGSGAAAARLWGAQLEAGSVPTTYIPTVADTASRAAETLTVTVPPGLSHLLVTYDDGSTSLVACVEGANVYTAADFARTRIKSMKGMA